MACQTCIKELEFFLAVEFFILSCVTIKSSFNMLIKRPAASSLATALWFLTNLTRGQAYQTVYTLGQICKPIKRHNLQEENVWLQFKRKTSKVIT